MVVLTTWFDLLCTIQLAKRLSRAIVTVNYSLKDLLQLLSLSKPSEQRPGTEETIISPPQKLLIQCISKLNNLHCSVLLFLRKVKKGQFSIVIISSKVICKCLKITMEDNMTTCILFSVLLLMFSHRVLSNMTYHNTAPTLLVEVHACYQFYKLLLDTT